MKDLNAHRGHHTEQEPCPICAGESQIRQTLPAQAAKEQLGRLLGDNSVTDLQFPDYTLRECSRCSLIFSSPPTPGDASFYSWLTGREGYYSDARWEWQKVMSVVSKDLTAHPELLLADIGCGSGQFLKTLPLSPNARFVGIDSSAESVKAGHSSGLEIHQGDWALLEELFPSGLDIVTAFHCLEHLPDPIAFVRYCKERLRPGGRLFVSTPLYPSSTEEGWTDPLNSPPHHLTRWNIRAFHALAAAVECQARIHLPPADSLLSRTIRNCRFALSVPYASIGASRKRRTLSTALGILMNPRKASKIFAKQVNRQKIDGEVAPDVILAEFSRLA